ncbi:MAG: PHP domain-containing protein [Ignavibacteriaceae bacterium]|nr:PHP domain-containing protein [Ignavibacteriaceae bacterium]
MIPLHVHSCYSFLEGTITIPKLIERAGGYGVKTLALTDTNGMYGLISFAKQAKEAGIKPVLGAYIDDPNDPELNALFYARNDAGYSELCKLITIRRLRDDFYLRDVLEKELGNFFVITSSLKLLKIISPRENLYAGLTISEKQKKETKSLYEYSTSKKIKLAALRPIYFLNKDDYFIHKVVRAIDLNTTIDNLPEDEITDPEFYFSDPEEDKKLWRTMPEAIKNTEYIGENCNVDLKFNEYKFPKFDLPPGQDSFSKLWELSHEGLKNRYGVVTDKLLEKVSCELEVIRELNFTDYFLIVWDIVREAHNRGMMLIGRGSAANSLVAYCLGLTQVDPIELNLYFERFLNKGRSSPPDVDLDFSWKERDEIVKYVFDKYGYENVAMISTHVTFRARSAFRESAKAFGFSDEEISKYAKFIPWTDAVNFPNIAELFPESRSLNFKVEPWKSIVETAVKIANFPRHLSIHPSGIIITPKPITNFTALEYAKNKGLGLIITQPDMYGIEDLGLIKIDLLSQRSLGVLRDTMNSLNNPISEDDI